MCRPADRESLNVERGFLEPRGVVDGEDERAETDLAAEDQIAAGRHGEDGKRTSPESRLDACPTVGTNCRGNVSDSR